MLFNKKVSSAKFPYSPIDTDAGLRLLQFRQQQENTPQPSSLFSDSIPSQLFDNDSLLNNDTLHVDRRDYFMSKEASTSTSAEYMEKQSNITKKDRTVIINWLLDIELRRLRRHRCLILDSSDADDIENMISDNLSPGTVHFAINFMDRYLAKVLLHSISELYIVGSTCLLLASKFVDWQDISLTIDYMVHVLKEDKFSFSKDDIIEMEHQVLKVLDYTLYVPTSYSFIDVYWNLNLVDDDTLVIASRILLLCLLSYDALKYLPSEIATAALWMGRTISGGTCKWTGILIDGTTYSEDKILPIALDISMMLSAALITVDALNFQALRISIFSAPKLPSARVIQNEDNMMIC